MTRNPFLSKPFHGMHLMKRAMMMTMMMMKKKEVSLMKGMASL